jgi:hypothetical protein
MLAASQMIHIAPVSTESTSPVQTSTFMCVRRVEKFRGKRVDPIASAAKKNRSRRQQRRCKMCGTNKRERIGHRTASMRGA